MSTYRFTMTIISDRSHRHPRERCIRHDIYATTIKGKKQHSRHTLSLNFLSKTELNMNRLSSWWEMVICYRCGTNMNITKLITSFLFIQQAVKIFIQQTNILKMSNNKIVVYMKLEKFTFSLAEQFNIKTKRERVIHSQSWLLNFFTSNNNNNNNNKLDREE